MMTKEEYQRNLIRMLDSIRVNYKGAKHCGGVNCHDCPLDEKICNKAAPIFYMNEAAEIVEQWAKEHPVKTNADKFREVFGMEKLPFYSCIYTNADCRDCEHFIGMGCKANGDFWNAEYKGKTEGCEEE